MSTDVTTTKDTQGGMGDASPYYASSDYKATTKDTEQAVGETSASTYNPRKPNGGILPDTTGTKDTEGVTGGPGSTHVDDWDVHAGNITGTLSTLEPGSPTRHASPAYRAPAVTVGALGAQGSRDTTLTDKPISDGTDPDIHNQYMTGTKDTVNPKVVLQTTTANLPSTPGSAPTVAARPRGVLVTVTALSDPTGAHIRGYRVEGSTGGLAFIPADDADHVLSKVVDTLEPSRAYKFRYAAVNDNGVGAWSPWSSAVVPLNPDEPGPGHASGLTEDNKVNPIYLPSGAIKPGTGGTTGAPATATAAATLVSGEFKIDWTAPAWGTATGYKVVLSTGESATLGNVLTKTFTGLSAVARTALVTPVNARGNGIAKRTNSATPLA